MTPPKKKRSHHKKPAPTATAAAPASRLSPADFAALELPPVVPVVGDASPADALAALEVAERAAAAVAPLDVRPSPAPAELPPELPAATRAVVAKAQALDRMVGVFCSGIFDLVALWTSLDQVRLDDDEETELGELGGPALAPYMGEYSKHAPLFAFGARLATVVTTKVFIVRAVKAAASNGNGSAHG